MKNTNAMERPRKPRVGMISLGCAKNLVDAEIMLGNVLQRGMEITSRADDADVLVVANTILAMAIDLQTFKPCLGNVMGGLSGPAVKPIVLRQVYQCARTVGIPVIGCGGISTTEDAVEYLLAGATAVQVGTATFVQPAAMTTIIDGLAKFCERRELDRISDLIGAVINEEADEPELAWVAPRS